MEEIWKDIYGYQVSSLGRVRNRFYKILKPSYRAKNKYPTVKLCVDGEVKTKSIHRLVAEAFIPNPNNLPEVNHKDENPSNNRVDNLEWCTKEYNRDYSHIRHQKGYGFISPSRKAIIAFDGKHNIGTYYNSAWAAANYLKIDRRNIIKALKDSNKTAYGFRWEYA